MTDNFNKNRIVKNSLLLYVRMLFTMWLNLWITRLVLANLGVEDMGVYGVVGSIVGLVSVFTGGVTNAVQRFITFEAGKPNGKPNMVFCSSLNIIFLLSAIVFLLLEAVGVYMLFYSVNIPAHSMNAAFWVLQLSILTCIVNLISIPYNALIIAHEKMDAFAVISILQVVFTFGAVYTLTWFDNRLLVYGIMMAAVSVVIRVIYQIYCHYKFDEARYHLIIDKEQLKQLGKFTGVSTASGALQVVSSQGIVFVINWTFGVAINAVYSISLQLKNSILSFALNLFKAISPQITKTYANGEIETHKKLVYSGSKLEVYLIYFIMIPFLFRTDYIMHLWLGNVPPYAVQFAQCTVFISLTYALFEPIRASVFATNRITRFLIIPEIFYLLVLPVGYAVSKTYNNPAILIAIIVGMDVLTCGLRTYYAVKVSPLKSMEILKEVLMPSILVAIFDSLICYGLCKWLESNILDLVLLLIINSIALVLIIVLTGLNKAERNICMMFACKIKEKITKNIKYKSNED